MSTRPTGAHPTPEEVDALLDPTGGDPSVAKHVSGCPACTSVRVSLEEVRSLLRAEALRVPDPPADLDARIASALAGASRDGAEPSDPAALGTSATADVVPLDSRRRRIPSWLAVAAGVAVLAGVALTTSQLVGSGLNGADNITAGTAQEEDSGAEAAPNALQDGELKAVATGTDYGPVTLPDQVNDLVGDVRSGRAAAAPPQTFARTAEGGAQSNDGSSDQDGELSGLTSRAGIAACLDAIGAGGQAPVAVDLATYQGEPAAVVVLPSAGGGLDVWVVSRTCAPGDDGLRQFTHIDP